MRPNRPGSGAIVQRVHAELVSVCRCGPGLQRCDPRMAHFVVCGVGGQSGEVLSADVEDAHDVRGLIGHNDGFAAGDHQEALPLGRGLFSRVRGL